MNNKIIFMTNPHYFKMTIALIFDVETTGLLPKNYTKDFPKNVCNLPRILQISFILYDIEHRQLIETYNQYIWQDIKTIDPIITNLTGIDMNLMNKRGIPMEHALEALLKAFCKSTCVVAHNLDFDSRMIMIECERYKDHLSESTYSLLPALFDATFVLDYGISLECTMMMTVNFCNLERENARGTYKKLPKLVELYQILFDKIPENLHNSMVDVFACLRCYLKYKYNMDLEEEVFQKMIDSHL